MALVLRPQPPALRAIRIEARRVFRNAVNDGSVVQRNKCERCQHKQVPGRSRRSLDGIEAHHEDYRRPLRVEWLCHWCHTRADQAKRERERAQGYWTELPPPVRSIHAA